jgi:hypothetical protein
LFLCEPLGDSSKKVDNHTNYGPNEATEQTKQDDIEIQKIIMTENTHIMKTDDDPIVAVAPGQRLGHVDDFEMGEGTVQRGQHIYASVVGFREEIKAVSEGARPIIAVRKHREPSVVPQIGDVVITKVQHSSFSSSASSASCLLHPSSFFLISSSFLGCSCESSVCKCKDSDSWGQSSKGHTFRDHKSTRR